MIVATNFDNTISIYSVWHHMIKDLTGLVFHHDNIKMIVATNFDNTISIYSVWHHMIKDLTGLVFHHTNDNDYSNKL